MTQLKDKGMPNSIGYIPENKGYIGHVTAMQITAIRRAKRMRFRR